MTCVRACVRAWLIIESLTLFIAVSTILIHQVIYVIVGVTQTTVFVFITIYCHLCIHVLMSCLLKL